jgi:ABC-type spermidine/putrescine transport system permease subunit I
MPRRRPPAVLLLPAMIMLGGLLVVPFGMLARESVREFVPGRISASGAFTLSNYGELLEPVYLFTFLNTLRIATESSLVGVALAYLIAFRIARSHRRRLVGIAVGFFVAMLFLSAIVRVYSLQLTFGAAGLVPLLSSIFGINPNGGAYIETLVIGGLCSFIIPISVLMLVGTIQNINPRLSEAAQALGAPSWQAHLTVTVPLSVRGLASAFLVSFTIATGAYVVPMILGKGKLPFVANLVYARFSEVANYPSGAAIAVVMISLSLAVLLMMSKIAGRSWQIAAGSS